MEIIRVTRYLRGFKVEVPDSYLLNALDYFHRTLIQAKVTQERGRMKIIDGDKYFIHSPLDHAYYYGIWHWRRVMEIIAAHAKQMPSRQYKVEITDVLPKVGKDAVFDNHGLTMVEPETSAFAFQNDIVDFGMEKDHAILEVQTGKGKTALSQKTAIRNSKRVLYLTKAGYVTKWQGDLTTAERGLKLKPKELISVSGVDNVDNLIAMGRDGDLDGASGRVCKAILLSSNTFDLWIEKELNSVGMKNILTFMDDIGCDFVTYDETHEQFRMNYLSYIVLNARKVMDLTATIINNDEFVNARYKERLPIEHRYSGLAYDIYAKATSVYYYFQDKKTLQRINKLKMYNHNELEKTIMRNKSIQKGYFEMVHRLMEIWYFSGRKEGQKALVFFSSKEMCTRFRDWLASKYPDLVIARNIQGDKFDAFIEADIGISTPIKSGTAVDIPGLVTTFCTVALGKEDKNLQILGRLRKVTSWDLDPRIVYVHCPQIPKHLVYLNIRHKLIKPLVKSFDILNSKFMV